MYCYGKYFVLTILVIQIWIENIINRVIFYFAGTDQWIGVVLVLINRLDSDHVPFLFTLRKIFLF